MQLRHYPAGSHRAAQASAAHGVVPTHLEGPLIVHAAIAVIAANQLEIGTDGGGMVQQALRRLRICTDGRLARSVDTGFLEADVLAVVTQNGRMVDIHTHHHRHIRLKDIHRIQPPTQANFHDGHIDFFFDKAVHGTQGAELEIGQRGITARRIDGGKTVDDALITDRLQINRHPLVVVLDMRRGITTHLETGTLVHGGQHGTDRTLAIGTLPP
jgi:hypothetical protein